MNKTTKNLKKELKPCPFCGGNAKIIKHSFYNTRTKRHSDYTYSVECLKCGSQTYSFYENEQQATGAWNNRLNWRADNGNL